MYIVSQNEPFLSLMSIRVGRTNASREHTALMASVYTSQTDLCSLLCLKVLHIKKLQAVSLKTSHLSATQTLLLRVCQLFAFTIVFKTFPHRLRNQKRERKVQVDLSVLSY